MICLRVYFTLLSPNRLIYIGYNQSYGGISHHQTPHLSSHLPYQPIRYSSAHVGTYLFMTWTSESGLAPLVSLLYDQKQIKTFAQELLIVVNTSYYFSLIVIVAFAAAAVYRLVANRSSSADGP